MSSAEEFRVFGKAMIDYVADYLEVECFITFLVFCTLERKKTHVASNSAVHAMNP